MLSKDFQIRLLAERGISKEEAEKIINSEDEQSPELGEGRFYSQTDIDKIGQNKKTEGFKFGADQVIEAIKKAKGLDYPGLSKLNENGSANIEETAKILTENYDEIIKSSYTGKVDDQVKDLEEKIKVQKTKYEQQLEEQQQANFKLSNELLTINSNNEIYGYLPENINSPKMGIAAHIRTVIDPYQENGDWFAKDKSSNIIKNDMHDPMPLKDIVLNFLDRQGYIKKDDTDTGGGDFKDGKANFKSYDEYQKYCQEKKIEPMSEEGQKLLVEAKANGLKVE